MQRMRASGGRMSAGVEGPAIPALRVLVIEDDAIIAMVVEDMLTDLGCARVDIVDRLEPALAAAAEAAFDLAILDLDLYGRKTHAVADILKARAIPFVLSSGYAAQPGDTAYAGVAAVHKPFEQRDLERAIAQALGIA
jgi:CheY-like chemotaxis protein